MAKCKKCGATTKYNGDLCYKCYHENKNKVLKNIQKEVDKELELEEMKARLSEKDWNCRYGMIKGRIAETLIQELFLSLGYNVFRYGMGNTIPGIIELLKGVRSDVAQENLDKHRIKFGFN